MIPRKRHILGVVGLLLPALCLATAQPDEAHSPETGKPIQLAPFKVQARPISSFGIALAFLVDRESRMIRRMFVTHVVEGSEAAWKGLRPGSEILTADGVEVSTLEHRVDPTSKLHQLFIDRKRLDRISLKVICTPEEKPRTIVLTEGRDMARPLIMQWLFP